MKPEVKAELIAGLQSEILRLQGFKSVSNTAADAGLGDILQAFPNGIFPTGAVHEFLSVLPEDAAATQGFVSGLLSSLMGSHGIVLWVSASRKLFPPALKIFGVDPDRFLFIDLQKESDVLWAMDEALKCGALTAVIGEVQDISFKSSRRLQLAVEQSQVTGFILRHSGRLPGTTACVSRWKITSLSSTMAEDLPGVGFPTWRVELMRIRNGKPGSWSVQWRNNTFTQVHKVDLHTAERLKKVG